MSDILHLDHNQSVQKVKDMAERADICFFTTALTELPLSTRPMSTQKVGTMEAYGSSARKTVIKTSILSVITGYNYSIPIREAANI